MEEKNITEKIGKYSAAQQASYMLKYYIISYISADTDIFSPVSPDPLWT